MVAGVHPVLIKLLKVFPPVSELDPNKYGNQNSTITAAHIEANLDGLTVDEALGSNRLFILDHHDVFMPYIARINSTAHKAYATRTLLFLKADSTLKPLAIELSLPHPDGEQNGAVSKVYSASENGVDGSLAIGEGLRRRHGRRCPPARQPLAWHARNLGAVHHRDESTP
ncbi:unnamed protein product [Musa acuminata var. zebrina]